MLLKYGGRKSQAFPNYSQNLNMKRCLWMEFQVYFSTAAQGAWPIWIGWATRAARQKYSLAFPSFGWFFGSKYLENMSRDECTISLDTKPSDHCLSEFYIHCRKSDIVQYTSQLESNITYDLDQCDANTKTRSYIMTYYLISSSS